MLTVLRALTITLLLTAGACSGGGLTTSSIGDSCGELGWGRIVGAAAGGAAGGLLGSSLSKGNSTAAALGAVGGLLAGGFAGAKYDEATCLKAKLAKQQALQVNHPLGQTVNWSNPDNGSFGSYTPIRQGRNNQTGAYCREYQETVTIGGQQRQAFGQACQQPDGSWRIVN